MAGQALYKPERMAPALKTGYERFGWVRKSYGAMCRELGGRHYGDNGDERKRPVNLLKQFCDTVVPNLLNQRPTVVGRSRIAEFNGEALLVALALELLWQDMDLVERIHANILDGLLSPISVCKLGLRAGADVVKIGERGIMLGQPYMCRVSPDDYVADPAARSLEELCWQGHRYRVPREYALESGIYNADAIAALSPLGKNRGMDDRSGVEDMSGRSDSSRFKAQEYIELWDVAIRDEDRWLIGTMAGMDGGDVRPAWVNADGEPFEFDGDAAGPYESLSFYRMPDNLPGVSPGMGWLDLHFATDQIYNKMIRQAMRSKRNFAYNRAAADDALTLKNAPDGEAIAVENVDSFKDIETGGVIAEFFPMIENMTAMWNTAAGNVQLLAGAGVQSDKATGQQILQANMSTRLSYMRDRVWRFCNAVNRRLAGYLMSDPLIQLPLPYRLEGGETVDVVYDAASRRGDANQMRFELEVSSMVGRDPELALKRKIEALGVLQQFAATPGLFDLRALARQMGREIGWTDMDEIVMDVEQQALLMQAGVGESPKAAVGGPGAGNGMPNRRAGMVRSAYGTGAEMAGVGGAR